MMGFRSIRAETVRIHMGHPWDRFRPRSRREDVPDTQPVTRKPSSFGGKKRLTRDLDGV